MLAAFSMVSFIFYSTEFRDVLEDWFFDARTRWAMSYEASDDIVVLAIDEYTIEKLDLAQPRIHYDSKKRPFLSIEALTRVTRLLANSEAKAMAVLLPNHAFPHSDERLTEFIDIIRRDQRMLVGTTEYNRVEPGVTQIPYPLKIIEDRLFGYETFRKRSNVVVRSLPYRGYRGITEELMLPVKLATMISGSTSLGDRRGQYLLNILRPEAFNVLNAALADSDPSAILRQISGKIVIVGYTVHRDIPFQTTDMMLVNTPLNGDEQNVEHGISTTYLVANAVENLVHNRQLRQASPVFNFMQTILVAAICGLVWKLGSFAASLLTVAFWTALVYVHSLTFIYFNYTIPLADTFLASALISIFAAVRRLKVELQEMAAQQAESESKREIARVQSLFLDDFATWLKSMTSLIVETLQATQRQAVTASPENAELYQRAFAAGEDFSEYLEAIRQIPAVENLSQRPKKETVDVSDLLNRIIRRFELKIQDKFLNIEIEITSKAGTVKANKNLLDSILFNFISNAVKYSPSHKKILIRAVRDRNRNFVMSVTDEGPGIPANMREKIFEKFYRIQDDRLYKTKGTGLGLYLCRFFAERMGGRVDVQTAQTGGSEFRVILP